MVSLNGIVLDNKYKDKETYPYLHKSRVMQRYLVSPSGRIVPENSTGGITEHRIANYVVEMLTNGELKKNSYYPMYIHRKVVDRILVLTYYLSRRIVEKINPAFGTPYEGLHCLWEIDLSRWVANADDNKFTILNAENDNVKTSVAKLDIVREMYSTNPTLYYAREVGLHNGLLLGVARMFEMSRLLDSLEEKGKSDVKISRTV